MPKIKVNQVTTHMHLQYIKISGSILVFLCLLIFLSFPAFSSETKTTLKRPIFSHYVPGEILVKYKSDTTNSSSTYRFHGRLSTIKKFRHTKCDHIKLPEGMRVQEALDILADDPDVLWAEPNYIRRQMAIAPPDDPFFTEQWGLHNTGQRIENITGTAGADIDALEAWGWNGNTVTDCSDIIIAVIDSGINYTHPDLVDNLWTNPGETVNGIDDDGNGYVDDIHGWNFIGYNENYSGNSNIFDSNGHGTHVAGIIAARGNNGIGITGVCWTAKIMSLKFLDDSGVGTSVEEIAAIEYAIDKGVKIINASFGEEGYIQAERDAIDAAGSAGILFIAASGNDEDHNNDIGYDYTGDHDNDIANYPASYNLNNIISVGASDQYDYMPSWSAYGYQSVDVLAPGRNIYGPSLDYLVSIFEESFESLTNINTWELEEAWGRTSDQSYEGSYALSVLPQNISLSETSAISPKSSIAGKDGMVLSFYLKGNYVTDSQTLFVETASNSEGPWTNQFIEITNSDDAISVFDEGISGADVNSSWTSVRAYLILSEGSETIYIRFRIHVANEDSNSDDNSGFCFLKSARASTYNTSAWYIDDILLQGIDTSYAYPPTEYYTFIDGTSAAVPFVSGLAGLIWNRFPGLSYGEVKEAILEGVDEIPSVNGKTFTGGRINAYKSLDYADGL